MSPTGHKERPNDSRSLEQIASTWPINGDVAPHPDNEGGSSWPTQVGGDHKYPFVAFPW